MDGILKFAGNFLAGNNPHARNLFNRVSDRVNGDWSQNNVAVVLSSIAQSEDGVNDIYNFIQTTDESNMLLSLISQIKNTSVTGLKSLTKHELRDLFSQYANFHQVRRETAFFASSSLSNNSNNSTNTTKEIKIDHKLEKPISDNMVFSITYVINTCSESIQNNRLIKLINSHPESEMIIAIMNSHTNSYPQEILQIHPIRGITTAEVIVQHIGDEQINSVLSHIAAHGIPEIP